MAEFKFNRGRYQVGLGFDFEAATTEFVLVDDDGLWTPDADDDFVATIVANGGIIRSDREPIINPTVSLDDAGDRALWGCDAFTIGGVANGDPFTHLLLYNLVTDDNDSWLLACWDLADTGDGSPISASLTTGYLMEW